MPKADRGTNSREPVPSSGDENAGTVWSPSLLPSEVVEDPVSHPLPMRNSTSGRSEKGKKAAPVARLPTLVNAVVSITKREAGTPDKLVPRLPLREEKSKFASLGTTSSEDEGRGGTITPEADSRTELIKPFILMEMLALGQTRLAFSFYAE
ncbi:hypothetical protein ACEPAI_8435 [Sanghuangporus weigelae]